MQWAMQPRCEPSELPDRTPENEKRRHGRMRCGSLRCELGRVSDVSASGMRVMAASRRGVAPGELRPVTLRSEWGTVEVQVRVGWVKRIGWWRHEIGLQFDSLDDATRRTVFALAFRAGMRGGGLDEALAA